jgi:hypothetical protein
VNSTLIISGSTAHVHPPALQPSKAVSPTKIKELKIQKNELLAGIATMQGGKCQIEEQITHLRQVLECSAIKEENGDLSGFSFYIQQTAKGRSKPSIQRMLSGFEKQLQELKNYQAINNLEIFKIDRQIKQANRYKAWLQTLEPKRRQELEVWEIVAAQSKKAPTVRDFQSNIRGSTKTFTSTLNELRFALCTKAVRFASLINFI